MWSTLRLPHHHPRRSRFRSPMCHSPLKPLSRQRREQRRGLLLLGLARLRRPRLVQHLITGIQLQRRERVSMPKV